VTKPSPERISAQILVIGSGAGGAVAAATLAEAGYDVLIIEEGPEIDTSQMATHTPEAFQTLYRNGGLSPFFGKANIAFVEGRCVGGSTEVNSAFWHRTPPEAVIAWTERFQVRDLSEDQLSALFDEIETELSVSRLNSDNAPRSSALLRQGSEKSGWAVAEVPRAQNSNMAGSQFAPGAKRSMSRTYIPRAIQAGVRLLPNCHVKRINHRLGRVSSVSALFTEGNSERHLTIEAETVFVCGGAIQTPVLLRRSGIKRNVGNRLRIHPMLKLAALFDEQLDSHRAALPVYQVKEFAPDITLGGAVFTPGYLAITLSENWPDNQAAMQDWRSMALYYVACRSSGWGTVRAFPLTGEAVVRYRLSRQDMTNLSVGMARLGELLFAAGARQLYPALRSPAVINSSAECRVFLENPIPASMMNLSTVHAFSTCPLGENKNLCAVDSYGKVHGFDNLYITDASTIPDSPGVNPQATVMALTLRNTRRFIETAG
jgi:choline dehydrogenase-like flavoprotein